MIPLLYIWLLSSMAVFSVCVYAYFREEFEPTKDNQVVLTVLITAGPIGLGAMLFAVVYDHNIDVKRKKCNAIMAAWERSARGNDYHNTWGWYMDDRLKEERYNMLRESIRTISNKNLEFLSSIDKESYDINDALKSAIIDEMMERKIINHE